MEYSAYTNIDFKTVNQSAKKLATLIEEGLEEITNILLKYESYEVVLDEVDRTLDLLKNLEENKDYFKLRIGGVTSFLPRNQPLYAFTCFVVVPSLMAESVHFRIPSSMKHFFTEIIEILNIKNLFPNIYISQKQRLEFLRERSALYLNKQNKETTPVTDVVIFTGTSVHADHLRTVFDKRTLFISNGSGHNPVVVSENAKLDDAIEAVLALQFYNQGQDCAAPNSILVQKNILPKFIEKIVSKIKKIKVGEYTDRNCKIGPISDPKDLVRIQDFIIENREWLHEETKGIIRSKDSIVEPTLILKPLSLGGNYLEIFAPIIFVQEYEKDADLRHYFEDDHYIQNAMYITLYGKSDYIKSLINKKIKGKVLHDSNSVKINTHLHAKRVERGTEPYGGYGYGASSISIDGKITPMPTLPQRDIYEQVTKPIIENNLKEELIKKRDNSKYIQKKNVEKILKLASIKSKGSPENVHFNELPYVDLHSINKNDGRYQKIKKSDLYHLTKKKNSDFLKTLGNKDLELIKSLKELLNKKSNMPLEEFSKLIYEIPKEDTSTDKENRVNQLRFFQNIYQLLFNKNSGPHLGPFLWGVEKEDIERLLDV